MTSKASSRAAAVLVAAALACLGACSRTETPPPAGGASNVKLTAAQRQNLHLYRVATSEFHRSLEVPGVVDFDNSRATSVLAPVSGPVSRLLVDVGDRVKAGDPMALVDSSDFATAVSTYRKALATARTNRKLADLDRDLLEHKGVAEREATQAETDAVNAEADRVAALQGLLALGVPAQTVRDIDAGRAIAHPGGTLRSPIAGTVVERLVSPGQLLQSGTTACFTVADLSRVWVQAQLFGADLAAVRSGDSADIVAPDGAHFPASVDKIAALVDPDTRSVAVRVVAENPKGVLRKQTYVRVIIRSREPTTGILIPVATLLRDDQNLPFVYVLQGDGSFARQHVTLGPRNGDSYEITEGPSAGSDIVADGGLFLQFMQDQ